MYDERISEVDGGTFAQLVFSCFDGIVPDVAVVTKGSQHFFLRNVVIIIVRHSFGSDINFLFIILHSAVMCIRGPRSSHHGCDLEDRYM